MASEDLGAPLGNAYAIAGGQARLFERGLTLSGAVNLEAEFAFPMIGKPDIVTGSTSWRSAAPALRFDPQGKAVEPMMAAIVEAIDSRLALSAVGQPTTMVPVVLYEPKPLFEATSPPYGVDAGTNSGALQDRQLYDVAIRVDDDRWHVIAPHGVYSRQSWTDFGIAHITDMHVARRIDSFRGILKNARRDEAAKRMYNWNDRFRGFVRYANYLYSTGVLDVIVATGDNYDFQFETNDDPQGGGNAAFLRDLILGKAPGPDFPDVEELRVPIFMVPGNHDYRRNPYSLIFDLHISDELRTAAIAAAGLVAGSVGLLGGTATAGTLATITAGLASYLTRKDVTRVPNYNGYRLSSDDATVIANQLDGVGGTEVQNIEPDKAGRMVEIDESNRPYRLCLAEPGSYVVELGPHRIAMIDSAHDVGVVTEQIAGALVKLGMGNEDQDAFVGGSPNCRGVLTEVHSVVKHALDKTEGLFIVGLHAPLFNPPYDGYSYFLRETQRAVQDKQVYGFLVRELTVAVTDPDKLPEAIETWHPTWFVARDSQVRDHRQPDYIKRVSGQDMFDAGVSRGAAEQLMQVLAGFGSTRAADLVLAGHTHAHNEYSVRKDSFSGELSYYFDFYTENPTSYYRTKFTSGWDVTPGVSGGAPHATPVTSETYVEVSLYAKPDVNPWPMPFEALTKNMVQVPPYPNPLNSAADPRAWWAEHRPLVVQTGALGPLKQAEFFSGFRVITVKNNVIDKMHFVSSARLEDNGFRMPWEQAIAAESGAREYHYVERSRPVGAPPAAGRLSGISVPAIGATNVVYRDEAGHLHEVWRKGEQSGTSDLTTLGDNAMLAANDPSSYIDPVDGLEVALYLGVDRHIYSLYWSTGAVRRDALSVTAGAPKGEGIPVGYVGRDGYRHVIYRADDGHLHELYWTGGNALGNGDLTTKAGAPHCAGSLIAYQKPNGENVVIYRGTDQHVHGLYWTTGDVRHDDLSGFARAPLMAETTDLSAYYTSHTDTHQIVYRSEDGHLHELWWQRNNPVSHWDLTAATPGRVGDNAVWGSPTTYYAAGNNTKHVIYRRADGHVHDLSWVPGTAMPIEIDLTIYAAAPLAAGDPTAFVVSPNTQYVLYKGKDNQIHEIRWNQPSNNIHDVRIPVTDAVELTPQPAESRWHRPMPAIDLRRRPR